MSAIAPLSGDQRKKHGHDEIGARKANELSLFVNIRKQQCSSFQRNPLQQPSEGLGTGRVHRLISLARACRPPSIGRPVLLRFIIAFALSLSSSKSFVGIATLIFRYFLRYFTSTHRTDLSRFRGTFHSFDPVGFAPPCMKG
jgi:hypothetical protein